jgi:hemoglobin-like flavoprotein
MHKLDDYSIYNAFYNKMLLKMRELKNNTNELKNESSKNERILIEFLYKKEQKKKPLVVYITFEI